jgi:uncharacterized Zn finger protein
VTEAIDLQINLEEWQDQLHGEFEICAEALRQGWNTPQILKAIPLAEDIMNRGQAESYQEAVNWLTKARSAYLQAGQQSEWRKYHAQLMATHGRKRKLMSLMASAKLS